MIRGENVRLTWRLDDVFIKLRIATSGANYIFDSGHIDGLGANSSFDLYLEELRGN